MLQEDISKVNFRHLKGLQNRKHESKLADEVRCFERENEKKNTPVTIDYSVIQVKSSKHTPFKQYVF